MNDEDKTKYYLDLYGYIPWTITIADAFDAGLEWHRKDVAQALRNAQADIDRLNAMTKEPTKLMAIPALMEAAGWARKKEWVGLSMNEAKDFYNSKFDRAELINKIDEFLEEKNNG